MQVLVYPHTIPADLPEKLKDMTHADGKTKLFPWISNNTGMMLKLNKGDKLTEPSSLAEDEKEYPFTVEETSLNTLEAYIHVLCNVFKIPLEPPSISQTILERHKAIQTDGEIPFVRFVGRTPENEIVSTGSYIVIGSRAFIFEIATLEAHRRKGYAARIVREIINHAQQKHGCESFYLHSSDAGKPLYLSFGFQTLCAIQEFVSASIAIQAQFGIKVE